MSTLSPLAVEQAPLLRRLQAGDIPSKAALASEFGRDPSNLNGTLKRLEIEGLIDGLTVTQAGALALEALARAEGRAQTGAVSNISLELIGRDPDLNPRSHFDKDDLQALADSIADKGVVQPILLRPSSQPGFYRIVAGERRYRASQIAGVRTIPALVRDLTDAQALEIALIENIQRVDLSAIEEARAFRQIIDARRAENGKLSQAAAAAAIIEATRKSQRYIEQRLQLLTLKPEDQARMALPADNPRHLTVTGARDVMQAHDRLNAEAAAVEIKPAQLLMLAEIAVFVAKDGKMKGGQTRVVDGAVRDDEAAIKGLSRKGLIFQFPNWNTGHDEIQITDKGLRLARLRIPKLDNDRALALREFAEKTLGDTAFAAWAERGLDFTTPWLNAPHELHHSVATERANRAKREADQAAAREQREADQAEASRQQGAAGRIFLAAVRELEAKVADMAHLQFAEAFSAFLDTAGIAGPYGLIERGGETVMVLADAAGELLGGAGPVLEGKRRLLAMAMNHAAGLAPYSGEPAPGNPWAIQYGDFDDLAGEPAQPHPEAVEDAQPAMAED